MTTDQYTVLGKAPGSDELKKLSQDDVCPTYKQIKVVQDLHLSIASTKFFYS